MVDHTRRPQIVGIGGTTAGGSSTERALRPALLAAVRAVSSSAGPGYYGSISDAVRNAIDLLEQIAKDVRDHLADLPVGLIATAYGCQATGSTVAAPRDHAA